MLKLGISYHNDPYFIWEGTNTENLSVAEYVYFNCISEMVNDHGVCSGIYQACCEIDKNKNSINYLDLKAPTLTDRSQSLFVW